MASLMTDAAWTRDEEQPEISPEFFGCGRSDELEFTTDFDIKMEDGWSTGIPRDVPASSRNCTVVASVRPAESPQDVKMLKNDSAG